MEIYVTCGTRCKMQTEGISSAKLRSNPISQVVPKSGSLVTIRESELKD